jgi:flagellar hook-associated protein FlgK
MKKTKRFYEGGMDEKEPGWESKEAPAVSTPKQRVVTKEELAKSGLNLRDFLNKERGLTRRGESAPVATPPAPAEVAQTSAPATTTVTKTSAPATSSSAPAAKGDTYRTLSGEVKTKKSAADIEAENAARRAKVAEVAGNVGSSIGNMLSKAKQNYESTRPVSRQVQKEREQAMSRGNLAKGGSVSKASSRADGIAQRGKTRGKMC